MTHLLVAVLAITAGWLIGRRGTRTRLIFIGGLPAQDQAALADELDNRFREITARLDLDLPDDPKEQP